MLRTEPQVIANQLLMALELSIRHHREAASRHGTEPSALSAVAAQRERLRDALRTAIRGSGDLPDALDPEQAELGELALRLRSSDGNEELLHLEREDEALLQLAAALATQAPALGGIAAQIERETKDGAARRRGAGSVTS